MFNVAGSLKNPPLVFLHGLLGVKEDWNEIISQLTSRFCCYCLDLQSPFQLIENTLAALDTLGLSKTPLVGYSLGGRLALMLKNLHPERFDPLILLSTHFGLSDEASKKERQIQDEKWAEMLEQQGMQAFLDAWYSQPLFASLKERRHLLETIVLRRLNTQNAQTIAHFFRHFSPAHQDCLKHLLGPNTLLLCGEKDLKFASLYKSLPSFIPVHKIAESGHALHLENPDACARLIQGFL